MRYVCMMLACLLMVGCQEEELVPDYGEGVGYLRLKLGKVDVELSSTTKAEAGELPDTLIPATADFMVDVKMGNKSVEGFPKKYSDIEADGIPLNAGTYTVTAYYGKNELIQTEPYFEGSSSVVIRPEESANETITAALANAMLEPAVSESLQNHYKEWTLTAKVGDESMTLAEKDNSDGYLFVQAEQAVNAVFKGTNRLGNETSQEWTVVSPAKAQTKYVIQCDPDLSAFNNIKISATAKHTYDAENMLTGTDVTLSMEGNNAPLDLVDGWNIQLLYNNTAIRTYTSKPENGTLMEAADGWPYVPQGSTLAASIHLKTGEMINLTSVEIGEIPQPEFTATVSGSTSYSVYKADGADAANAKDGSSIFDIAATASIASEISNNSNYANILKVAYTTDSGQDSGELPYGTVSQFNSLAWQKHALSATVSFDGVEKTSVAVECDVTGLPYRAEPPKNTGNNPWIDAAGNNDWNNDCVKLYYAAATYPRIESPTFHIPSDIKVGISTKIYREYYWASISKGDICIYQYNSTNRNESEIYKRELAREETFEPVTPLVVTMTSSLPAFYIQYNYMAATGRTNVYYFNIDYK